MTPGSVISPNGVYRTPGRVIPAGPIPLPSARTLLGPVTRAAGSVLVFVAPIVVLHLVVAPALPLQADTGFVPIFEQLENAAMLLLPASLLLLLFLVARRVAPSWRGMRLRTKVLYVVAVVCVQSVVAMAGEATIFFARGGLHLFEPTWKSSTFGPNGKSAHIYREGFGCGYDVYVSEPLAITMKRQLHVGRKSCEEPLPTVRWNPSGAIDLVDRAGKPLESEATGSFLGWGGGC
jgi:hypothetical protein